MDDEPLFSYGETLVPRMLKQSESSAGRLKKSDMDLPIRQMKHADQLNIRTNNPTPELTTYGGIKLGWIQGVLIPCLLNIWGVMLFLRIAWVVAQAGIALTIVIITMASTVCIITTLSLSAICTNGAVSGGGVYYLVSRTLGAELGASVGLIFAFANAVAASMNTIGFCESLNELLRSHGLRIIDNNVADVRIIGAIALLVMCTICAFGMDWETKTQNFLIVIIIIAIFNYILGSCLGPNTDQQRAQGFVGINQKTTKENWLPNFRDGNNFFSVFAIYFPAVTGVQAGANICGDLKNPAEAIPKGTLWALAVSITSYLVMALLAGTAASRDASGHVPDLHNGTLASCAPNCKYGLHNNYEIMQLMAFFGPLIYGGCWAATLSTALTNLLSVPRLIQALGVDRIYPGLIFFSKPYGRYGEPYRGYVLTFFVSLMFLLIAELDKIAPLITNFYLASYALINFCTFHAALVHHISWRPTFKYHNIWLSLIGFLMCGTIMVIISWMMALITIVIFGALYLYVLYKKPGESWGSSTEAYRYRDTVTTLLTLTHQIEHAKSYNPQVLVLCHGPIERTALLDIGHLVTKMGSFMIIGEVSLGTHSHDEIVERKQNVHEWLGAQKYRSFYTIVEATSFEAGVRALVQIAGLGRLSPNIVMIGYKSSWHSCELQVLSSYVNVLWDICEQQLAICILRVPQSATSMQLIHESQERSVHYSSDMEISDTVNEDKSTTDTQNEPMKSTTSRSLTDQKLPSLHKPFILDFNANLDVWWLFDDGGLNILLPYVIANRSGKTKMPLRIFALARRKQEPNEAYNFFTSLLAKYRLEYTNLSMITGLDKNPLQDTWDLFDSLVTKFKNVKNSDCIITDDDLTENKHKTTKYLRLREKLLESSSTAGLVVISLPKEKTIPSLYMAWLEILSRGLPPMLFVRGNQADVIND